MIFEFRLPDIGEGLAESEIVGFLVKVGDQVTQDQPIVKIENDKALTELPAPVDGTVKELLYKAGDMAETGSVIMTIETDAVPEKSREAASPKVEEQPVKQETAHVKAGSAGKRRVRATPHTRKVVRELGIDISAVTGTGKGGRITDSDVQKYAESGTQAAPKVQKRLPEQEIVTTEPEIIPFRGIRRTTALNLSRSWEKIPHVTHSDEVDITEIMEHLKRVSFYPEYKENKITLLAVVFKAVCMALKEHPFFNSRLEEESNEIHLLKEYNLGFAVDTEAGLMVPVVKNADRLSIVETAERIKDLALSARSREIQPEDLKGGTFTITNVGAFGGTMATPIILHPQAAILGMMRAKMKPVVHYGEIVPRLMLPLVVSFDHRLIDGVAAAKFMDRIIKQLEDPIRLFVELR